MVAPPNTELKEKGGSNCKDGSCDNQVFYTPSGQKSSGTDQSSNVYCYVVIGGLVCIAATAFFDFP